MPFVAVTDQRWFEHLSHHAGPEGSLDEVNFWNPSGTKLKKFSLGEPVFFRLKGGPNAIAGYGFFAHFLTYTVVEAWEWFEEKNGAASYLDLEAAIASNRRSPMADMPSPDPIGCTILRDAVFWPRERWLPWGAGEGWHANIVRGKGVRDPALANHLLQQVERDHQSPPPELSSDEFRLVDTGDRPIRQVPQRERVGQGAFRARLIDAYGGRCAITGERTQPVLDAAHIQPYLSPSSNHVQNGILMVKEFHTLFDRGYVSVTPDHRIQVSPRLEQEWQNGRRYYAYQGKRLVAKPGSPALAPSPQALAWHADRVFKW